MREKVKKQFTRARRELQISHNYKGVRERESVDDVRCKIKWHEEQTMFWDGGEREEQLC